MDEPRVPLKYVFISYDNVDSDKVGQLQAALEASGVPVLRDVAETQSIENWRIRTTTAIGDSTVLLLCLSKARMAPDQSLLHEELTIAAESYRMRRPDVPWLIPVRFDECDVPAIRLGAGVYLEDIHPADLFGSERDHQLERLVEMVRQTLAGIQSRSTRRAKTEDTTVDDPPGLLLRFYVPTDRLYAAEMARLVSMFRDWLSSARGIAVRYSMHQTAAGTVHEFYSDNDTATVDLRREFFDFTGFLELCATNPTDASHQLAQIGLDRATRTDVVARYGREMRRLSIDLRYAREQRILTIRHDLDSEFLDNTMDQGLASDQIQSLVEASIPLPTMQSPLIPLASGPAASRVPITLNINQQVINAIDSQIVQNVEGTVNLGPRAQELIDLIDRFGEDQAATLRTAVQELEDPGTRHPDRVRAAHRLTEFLTQLGSSVQGAAISILQSYIEKKMHIS